MTIRLLSLLPALFFITPSLSVDVPSQCYDHPNPLDRTLKVPVRCPMIDHLVEENLLVLQSMFVVNVTCSIGNRTLCAKVENAFKAAGEIISSTLTLSTPINVNAVFVDFSSGGKKGSLNKQMSIFFYKGGASPARSILLQDDDGLARLYPQALVKQFRFKRHPEFYEFDITALFNAAATNLWFDGDPPIKSEQQDFSYVVLHEYIHGLGLHSSFNDHLNSEPTAITPNIYASVNLIDSSLRFNGFVEMAFDKYMIHLPTGKRISSVITNKLNQFVGRTGTIFPNKYNFSLEFKSSPQYTFALNMMEYAVTPNSLGFLPQGANKSSEVIVLETSLIPYKQGSSINHVDYKTYNKAPDFLMKYLADRGANITALAAARGTSGLLIGPKLKLLLETLGYKSPDNPNPYRPGVDVTSNSYNNSGASILLDTVNASSSSARTQFGAGNTAFLFTGAFIILQLIKFYTFNMVLPPITIPTFLQPIIQAWTVWFTTTFISIPAATFFMIWDIPKSVASLFRERPKVVLITGASSGIGAKFAEEYAKLPGVTLGLLARSEERLGMVADSCRKKGATVETLACDITRTDILVDTIEEFCNRHSVDLLIANAAQAGLKYDSDTDRWEDMWERIFEVNLNGTIATVMTVFKNMKDNKKGQIAITSSIVGHFSVPQMIYYNTTKSALISFARDLRYLASCNNVKVSVISPGLIDTPMATDPGQPTSMFRFLSSSPRNLAVIAKLQLYENWFEITWPFLEVLPVYSAQTLPPRVLEAVTCVVGRFWGLVTGSNGDAIS
ncbi:5357_t:CDS:2 [Acaulospora colombiana]|uniref:5357_t:CDS:1 n=1 Tax=Acaulospora colombiana TaxID=27376 RepID=A0ACA9LVC1_9GLOM|nr:5357_t:CDS:2 [Acaulospora colombiana]